MSLIEPDTKDWTWVLDRSCPECGLEAGAVAVSDLGDRLRSNAASWTVALQGPDVAVRCAPEVWSVLEYACHVRDVHRVMSGRARLILERDDPEFPNWDQDATALEDDYASQSPAVVATQLTDAARAAADLYDRVPASAWQRPGRRSNGSVFTLAGLARYHLHDVVHHVHDIAGDVKRHTIAAYDAAAAAYRDGGLGMSDLRLQQLKAFAGRLPHGSRVLEIGSGPGRDAAWLEEAGLRVRRTDVSPGFVDLLRTDGHRTDVLDPLTDDLTDPEHPDRPYDGIWASASLLHVARHDLGRVLERLAEATADGGSLHASFKVGDGEGWSTHGEVDRPRHFTFWRESALRALLDQAGWRVDAIVEHEGLRDERWLAVLATRSRR